MSKRRSLPEFPPQGSNPPQKQKFGIRSFEPVAKPEYSNIYGHCTSLAASVKNLLASESKPVDEVKFTAVDSGPDEEYEEILSGGQEMDPEAWQYATPLGPRLGVAASLNELNQTSNVPLHAESGQNRGIAAQRQFLATVFASATTPVNTPYGRSGEPVRTNALGPQLQKLLQEGRARHGAVAGTRNPGAVLEMTCTAVKVS
jgi:hypothetical protein